MDFCQGREGHPAGSVGTLCRQQPRSFLLVRNFAYARDSPKPEFQTSIASYHLENTIFQLFSAVTHFKASSPVAVTTN